MKIGDIVMAHSLEIGKIVEVDEVGKTKVYRVELAKDKVSCWYSEYELTLMERGKVKNKKLIKFKPSKYEFKNEHHFIVVAKGDILWNKVIGVNKQEHLLVNDTSIHFKVNGFQEIVNVNNNHRYTDENGIKRTYSIGQLMKDCEEVNELILDFLEEYEIKFIEQAYEEWLQMTNVSEEEMNELMHEITSMNYANEIDRALDEGNKEMFIKLTGGKE